MSKETNLTSLFGRVKEEHKPSGDFTPPAVSCTVRANLHQLVSYDNNPRQSINPLYDDIKASIRKRGLDHPPNVTVRPGETSYMIKDGGNTRLEIMRELYEETGDAKYFEFDCKFFPWVDELDTLAGHMVENEVRGGMLFVDRCLAAVTMRKLILEKSGEESISGRKLAAAISETGWSMNDGNLSVMLYAAEELLPYLPDAFWGGMGRDSVKRIRKLGECAAKYAESLGISHFIGLWQASLSESDADKFEYGDLFKAIANYLRAEGRVDGIGVVEAELDALLSGRASEPSIVPEQENPQTDSSWLDIGGKKPDKNNTAQRSVPGERQTEPDHHRGHASESEATQTDPQPVRTVSETPGGIGGTVLEEKATAAQPDPSHVNAIRADLQAHVQELISHIQLEAFVSFSDDRSGFTVNLDAERIPLEFDGVWRATLVAQLAQIEASILPLKFADEGESTTRLICKSLFGGNWEKMSVSLFQAEYIYRLHPNSIETLGRELRLIEQIKALALAMNELYVLEKESPLKQTHRR